MQSTFVNATSYFELCSAELLGYFIIIQANFKLTSRFATLIIRLLTFFLLIEHGKLSIAYLF